MSDDMRRLMAKKSPKTCKSVIDKAKYGILSNELRLTFGEMAELWSKNGLIKNTSDWEADVLLFADEVRNGNLVCENADVAMGKPDPQEVSYQRLISRMGGTSITRGDINYDPVNATVKKEAMLEYLRASGWLPFINDFLIEKWFHVDDKHNENNLNVNPAHKKDSSKANKDESAWRLIGTHPTLKTL